MESASTLTKCSDSNYVNHIDILKTVALKSIDVLCESQEQLISSAMNLTNYPLSFKNCALDNLFQLFGCIFSQYEVREIIADKRLISIFTLELLEGTDRKCGSLNEIQQCFIQTFENCDDKEFSNSFKLFSDMIFKSLHCKKNSLNKFVKTLAQLE